MNRLATVERSAKAEIIITTGMVYMLLKAYRVLYSFFIGLGTTLKGMR